MPTVIVRDTLRASVEAATGGKCTVLYTALNQPSYMRVIPRFRLQDINPALGSGVDPAFTVNGVEKSEIFIGMYPGIVKNGELISLPGQDPTAGINHDTFITRARACGAGWHVMTNSEYSALALWCLGNGFFPRGNTNYGASSDAPYETGVRRDGQAPGENSGTARTLTGSGPVSWSHDNTPAGIADLCGNVWEWAPGIRIVDGEIHIIPNNDAAAHDTDISATSTAWRAINGANGELVAPGHANAVKYATEGTDPYTLVRSGSTFEGMTNPGNPAVSAEALTVLARYGLYPLVGAGLGGDGFWLDIEGERLALRGGYWINGARAGVFALGVYYARDRTFSSVGARPAFVL